MPYHIHYASPGGVSEWLKEHAWKACVRHKRTVGSNPTSSEFSNYNLPLENYYLTHLNLSFNSLKTPPDVSKNVCLVKLRLNNNQNQLTVPLNVSKNVYLQDYNFEEPDFCQVL